VVSISIILKHYSHSDKILTGSFDKTARLWSAETGECYNTLWGHTAEVVTVQFNPERLLVGTSSLDSTAKLYHIATGGCEKASSIYHYPPANTPF
jgi:WD40 repeat protein